MKIRGWRGHRKKEGSEPYKSGFSLKLDREVENHSEETKSHSTEFPLMWLEE
jgi:hypothetical protein